MKIIFDHFDAWWIKFRVVSDSVTYDVLGSAVLADPLTNLLRAVLLLNEGEPNIYAEFWEEPDSLIWHLEQKDGKLFIHQYHEKDVLPKENLRKELPRNATFKSTIETDLNILTQQVCDLFTYLWNEYGWEKYQEIWNHEFPLKEYKKLLNR